ncbi:hypothetical protein, partial [Lentibacillus halophilus]|uniref:hypothetical protein n=1 Tax=Lentibacillus halophilus TaxID=295065 RepID=UPI0031E2D7A0
MNKQLTNFLTWITALFIILHLLIEGIHSAWNWFLSLLTSIGIWVETHIQIIMIGLIIMTLIPLIVRALYAKKLHQNNPTDDNENNIFLTEEEEQNKSFERWFEIKKNPTLDRTNQMIDILNEMLKSKRHRKQHENTYRNLLKENGLGYVYFIKAPDETTKIGQTRDPIRRIMKIFGGVNTSLNKLMFSWNSFVFLPISFDLLK